MPVDVVELRNFYASPLGKGVQNIIGNIVKKQWDNCSGLSILGIGYAPPYLETFRSEAMRVLAFMPAAQGVVNWPDDGPSCSALVETTLLPLPDSCMDRVIVIHALEAAEHPQDFMEDVWRVLTPGGKMILVCPSRGGFWARADNTPFGHGQPYSRRQLRDLMRDTLFSPISWTEALYGPPLDTPLWRRSASLIEKIGAKCALPGAGVTIVEATKQLYRPVGGSKRLVRRGLPQLPPVLAPSPAGMTSKSETTA